MYRRSIRQYLQQQQRTASSAVLVTATSASSITGIKPSSSSLLCSISDSGAVVVQRRHTSGIGRATPILLQGVIHNPVTQQLKGGAGGGANTIDPSLESLPENKRLLPTETLKAILQHRIAVPQSVLDARLAGGAAAAAAAAAELDAEAAGGSGGGVTSVDGEALIATVRMPAIVWEYVFQLGEARAAHVKRIEGLMAASGGGLVEDPHRNLSGSPFDMGLWTKRFAQDIDVADEAHKHLVQIKDAHMLIADQKAVMSTTASSDSAKLEEAEMMIEMAQEDVTSALKSLLGSVEDGGTSLLTSIVELFIRRADEAEGPMASSTVWTLETLGRAGGTEAGIFACDLIAFYKAYGEWKGWKIEDITDPGYTHGGKLRIEGDAVLQVLKHEMGTHRVQRVPTTESGGRMQTSTASVFVLPQPTTASVDIKESDCTFDFVRGSGPGGQGMQSSSNACVLTHNPTGLTFKVHQARSALGNRELALEMLAQKLWQEKNKVNVKYQNSLFAKQWTSGERGEKIRTYNFQQNRVTDHRIGADFGLISYMEGAAMAGSMHAQLMSQDRAIGISSVLSKLIVNGLSSDEPADDEDDA